MRGIETIAVLFAVFAIIAAVELAKAAVDQMPCEGFWGGVRIPLGVQCR